MQLVQNELDDQKESLQEKLRQRKLSIESKLNDAIGMMMKKEQ